MKKKAPVTLKQVRKNARGAGGKSPIETMKPSKKINRMNALDKAIMEGKTLPSKNKKVPADTDVKMKGMKAKPVIRIKKK